MTPGEARNGPAGRRFLALGIGFPGRRFRPSRNAFPEGRFPAPRNRFLPGPFPRLGNAFLAGGFRRLGNPIAIGPLRNSFRKSAFLALALLLAVLRLIRNTARPGRMRTVGDKSSGGTAELGRVVALRRRASPGTEQTQTIDETRTAPRIWNRR